MGNEHTLTFTPGLLVDQEYFSYKELQESAKNWMYQIKYRFGTGRFYGRHSGVQLESLQFGYADRHEGMLFEGFSPKACLTIGIFEKKVGLVCLNGIKVQEGDIILIDDNKPYDFVASHRTLIALISIYKPVIQQYSPHLLALTDKRFKDENGLLAKRLKTEWLHAHNEGVLDSREEIAAMQKRIMESITESLGEQTGETANLTNGEKVALNVKRYLLESMQESTTIAQITEMFDISDKTLETSFKSLFGITPKRFMELLKLNRAHRELHEADAHNTTVSEIATKWGFSHFGRFSKDYKALFGTLPSESLRCTPEMM